MNHTYSVIFFLKTDVRSSKDQGSIFLRITVNGIRAELSIKRRIETNRWNSKAGKVMGKRADARVINEQIDSIKAQVNKIHSDLVENDKLISAKQIRDIFSGRTEQRKSVLEVFNYHNEAIKAQIGKDYSESTYKRFVTTLDHISAFMVKQYKQENMLLPELKYKFITDFEFYMKTVRNCNHNSTLKYIRNFRKIINLAIKNEWLDKDPFVKYEVKLKETNREYLTPDELSEIETKDITIPRLKQVRDVFIFCCYTGLSFSDVEKLKPSNISKGIDGELWIFIERTKTGNSSNVPLLPQAFSIIKQYQNNTEAQFKNRLFPVLSNQKMNAYLKEIADICGINKNLTFHMARHTFATTVTLTNGVSIETISSMLGHKNIKTTQIYSKVVGQKVSNDMMELKKKLSPPTNKASNQ